MHYVYSEQIVRTDSEVDLLPGLITIQDALIKEVDWSVTSFEVAQDLHASVIDARPYLVTPAFINGHTHLAMCAFRGLEVDAMDGNVVEELYFRLEGMLSPEDVRAFTRMGAYESILSGVGGVWDHYYHAEAVALGLADVGLTGVIAPTLQDLNGPGKAQLDAQLEATHRLTDAAWRRRGISVAVGPHATDTVSDDLWRTVNELAETHHLFIHTHAAQSVEEYERNMTQHGMSPIERLDRLGALDAGLGTLLVHSLFVTQSDLARLRPTRNVLGYCPYSQVQFCFPAEAETWWSAGQPIIVGTDCGACNDTMNVQQELRLLTTGRTFAVASSDVGDAFRRDGRLERAVALEDRRRQLRHQRSSFSKASNVLDMVWKTPGQMDPVLNAGRITAGSRANLCFWDLNHPGCWPANDPFRTLVMSDMAGALWGMMLNGQWIGQRGSFRESILKSEAFQFAQNEAQQRLTHLYRNLGLPILR